MRQNLFAGLQDHLWPCAHWNIKMALEVSVLIGIGFINSLQVNLFSTIVFQTTIKGKLDPGILKKVDVTISGALCFLIKIRPVPNVLFCIVL